MVDKADSIRVHGLQYLLENLCNEHSMLIVDDVYSTGSSVKAVIDQLARKTRRNLPGDIRIATVWYRPSERTIREPDFYRQALVGLRDDAVAGFVMGLVAFVIGAVIVSLHNTWDTVLAAFVSLIGWRLLPASRYSSDATQELFDIADYITEVSVPEGSSIIGKRVRDLDALADKADVEIIGLTRRGRRLPGLARIAEIRVFPLQNARAAALTTILNDVLNTNPQPLGEENPNRQSLLQFINRREGGEDLIASGGDGVCRRSHCPLEA